MNIEELISQLGKVDIYLLDQVMKGRYQISDRILDAGCGKGRNLIFLNGLGYKIDGCDQDEKCISDLTLRFPQLSLTRSSLSSLPYASDTFDHIVCNAVLHFAKTNQEFEAMLCELYRILKPGGSLFVRMASIFGIEDKVIQSSDNYYLPDGTNRFLLTLENIEYIKRQFNFLEPLKTVNVNNQRCMSTLILEKKLL